MYFEDEEKNSHETITPLLPKEKVEMKDKTCCPRETYMGEMNCHLGTSDALEVKYREMEEEPGIDCMFENFAYPKIVGENHHKKFWIREIK